MLKFNLNEYRAYIKFSHNRRILVEGIEDKRVFMQVVDLLFYTFEQGIARHQIDIDTAEQLIGVGYETTRGNRDKVEYTCHAVLGAPYAEKLTGFVDREFRGFEWGEHFQDNIEDHFVDGRLVWSRGHSIENYFFESVIMRDPLRVCSHTERFNEALHIFEAIFESAIRSACAATLTGLELNRLSLIKGSIKWELFEFNSSDLTINLTQWRDVLHLVFQLTPGQAQTLVERYDLWLGKLKDVEFQIVKWLCHGHIGLKFLWEAYGRCVHKACAHLEDEERNRESRRVLAPNEDVRFNTCTGFWASMAIKGGFEYPRVVFQLLGLAVA